MEFGFLFYDWLGKPAWMWLGFLAIVAALLTLDLGVLHKNNREIEAKESLLLSAGYIGLGVAFGAWVWWYRGAQSGMEYMTGFASGILFSLWKTRGDVTLETTASGP